MTDIKDDGVTIAPDTSHDDMLLANGEAVLFRAVDIVGTRLLDKASLASGVFHNLYFLSKMLERAERENNYDWECTIALSQEGSYEHRDAMRAMGIKARILFMKPFNDEESRAEGIRIPMSQFKPEEGE